MYDWLPTTLFRSKRQKFTFEKDEMTITKFHFQTIEKQNSISNRSPTAVSCNKHARATRFNQSRVQIRRQRLQIYAIKDRQSTCLWQNRGGQIVSQAILDENKPLSRQI